MKRYLLFIPLLILINFTSNASHMKGSDLRMEQIAPNTFIVTLRFYITCSNIPLSSIQNLQLYDKSTNSLISSLSLSRDSVVNYNTPTSSECFILSYFSDTISLVNNPNGYYCNWVAGPRSIGSALNFFSGYSQIWTCDIPNPAIIGRNSNPVFNGDPISEGICVGQTKILNFSSTDPDGDNLVYSLITPYTDNSSTTGNSKPYRLLTYSSGYNLNNLLGPGSLCSLNSNTGMLSTRATQLGHFIIAVKCEEYRNGVKIGETVRDYKILATNCATTSVDEKLLEKKLLIYPNPSNGLVTIEISEPTILEVYNVNGVKVIDKEILVSNTKINLTSYDKGLYIFKFKTKDKSFARKIVVN